MIVKKEHIGSRLSTRQIAKLLGGLGIVLLLFLLLNIIIAFIPREDKMIVCDAETIALNGVNPDFIQGGYIFLNGNSRSSEFARSGRYSSKVEPKNKYGITHILKGARAGEQYVVSVWRMGNRLTEAHLAFSIDNGKLLHKEANLPVEFEPEGWEKLVLNVAIPYDYKGEEIKIYVYTNGKAPAYFDDLQIRRLDRQERIDSRIVYDTAFQHLNLQIDDKEMTQLDLKRKEALREFVLFTDDDDWVTGRISQENKEPVPVKLRLKGDQPDHFKTGQYSFRVKVKSPHAWNRMLTFSLHSSKARYHLAEWVYHKWMQAEDILTTRYDFLTLSLNKELLGVYAYEEHFEKQLVEFKSRREGPIVKFDEDAVWKAGARQSRLGLEKTMMGVELNSFEASEVQPFGESKILSSPVLAEQFKLAKNLMTQYQMGTKPASEVFDIDRLAKYYAIIDITEAYHSTIWHNQRFYYNPVTGRLEPIAFDGFTDLGPFNYNNKLLLGMDMRGLSDFQRDLHARLFMGREGLSKSIINTSLHLPNRLIWTCFSVH
ncbi:MAG: CotH kinase family protein [Bacteroidia bacterium]